MSGGKDERFLSRWSRLKQEAKTLQTEAAQPLAAATPAPVAAPAAVTTAAAAPQAPAAAELPPVESLSIESDFSVFMRPEVDEGMRRAAIKQLFRDPHFNIMDGLDVYIDDYSKSDPIPPEMLARLRSVLPEFATPSEAASADAVPAAAATDAAAPAPTTGIKADNPPTAGEPQGSTAHNAERTPDDTKSA
jgi:hypothetical protein